MSDLIPAPATLTDAIDSALAASRPRVEQLRALAPYFRPGLRVALSTHINADGDGCGSEVGLARALTAMGLRPVIVNPTPWPDNFRFLLDRAGDGPGDAAVEDASARGAAALKQVDLLVVLDIADVKRLGTLADTVRALTIPKLTIDHHLPSDEPPSAVVVSDTTASATGELIFDLLGALDRPLTPAIATALYTAMLTDTGGFRFSNTSPRCHAVAAELLAAGVDPEAMYRRIYAQRARGQALPAARGPRHPRSRATHRTVVDLDPVRRDGALRCEVGGPRRNRRAAAVDRGDAARAPLPRPRLRQGEGVVPQHGGCRRERARAAVRRGWPRQGERGDGRRDDGRIQGYGARCRARILEWRSGIGALTR